MHARGLGVIGIGCDESQRTKEGCWGLDGAGPQFTLRRPSRPLGRRVGGMRPGLDGRPVGVGLGCDDGWRDVHSLCCEWRCHRTRRLCRRCCRCRRLRHRHGCGGRRTHMNITSILPLLLLILIYYFLDKHLISHELLLLLLVFLINLHLQTSLYILISFPHFLFLQLFLLCIVVFLLLLVLHHFPLYLLLHLVVFLHHGVGNLVNQALDPGLPLVPLLLSLLVLVFLVFALLLFSPLLKE